MLKHPNQLTDDLFEKSSMSFGEHLEELRKALIKAAIWLAIGTALGLFVAEEVVKFIKQPLEKEVVNFRVKQVEQQYKKVNGVVPPKAMSEWMVRYELEPQQVLVDPMQIDRLLKNRTASEAAGSQSAPAKTPDVPKSEADTKPPTDEEKEAAAKAILSDKNVLPEAWKELSPTAIARLEPIILLRPIASNLKTLDPVEPFLVWLKAALLVGAVLGSPGIFWYLWQFLAAGLYPHERRYVYVYLPLSIFLFVAGVSLAFFVILPLTIGFLFTYNVGMNVDIELRLTETMSFALMVPLGFGIAFQLPLVMLALNRFGIFSVELYWSKWRIAVLAIAFVSMVLTPADAYTMIGMFVPLTFLYFFGIGLCKYMPKGRGLGSTAFDPQG